MLYSYKIEQAIRAAAVLHNGQTRKGNTPYPYITHLISVAFILADYDATEDTVLAGLLHDTLEDTDYTPEELQADFGPQVRAIVCGVTDALHHERGALSWAERQHNYFKALDLAPTESLMVAAADKIHNMRSIIEEYSADPERFLTQFGRNSSELMEKYVRTFDVLRSRLDNKIMEEYAHVHTLFIDFLNALPHEKH
jgi:(p)ppGpp synthase/HD superfamily hydrolase